ncbi:MAG: glycosyl hydrolase, partial [Microbacterium sp.]|nr:glycosyl hydrolase [Microbacterium sp.]
VSVTNTGDVIGREIVQVYTALPDSAVARAPRELKAFGSVALEPGETRTVRLVVRRADLAYWDIRVDEWVVEGGRYTVEVAASSRDIRATATVLIEGDVVRVPLSEQSSIGDLLENEVTGPVIREALQPMFGDDEGMLRMMASFPIGRLAGFPNAPVSSEQIEELLAAGNAES